MANTMTNPMKTFGMRIDLMARQKYISRTVKKNGKSATYYMSTQTFKHHIKSVKENNNNEQNNNHVQKRTN